MVPSRPETRLTLRQRSSSLEALRPADEDTLLGFLAEHEVLTTTQLVRLCGLPERTVQHRLGQLYRAGLISRSRPTATVGTSPYHCWLTSFGADVIGASEQARWGDDQAGMLGMAALNELWLALRERGPELGLVMESWRRLRAPLPYYDSIAGAWRELRPEAELVLRATAGASLTLLLHCRLETLPAARMATLVGRFHTYLAGQGSTSPRTVIAVLARTQALAQRTATASEELTPRASIMRKDRHGEPSTARRVVVGLAARPTELPSGQVWRRLTDPRWQTLAEVLTMATEGAP